MRLLLPLFCLLSIAHSAKIGIVLLEVSNSQIIFNKRVAETLLQANHSITMVMIRPFDKKKVKIEIDPRIKIKTVDAMVAGVNIDEWEKEQSEMIFEDVSIWDARQRKMMSKMSLAMTGSCEEVVQNKEFLQWFKDEKFEVVFSHMYDYCPIGLNHIAGVKGWVWLNSGLLMDWVADAIGVPLIPSYTPRGLQRVYSVLKKAHPFWRTHSSDNDDFWCARKAMMMEAGSKMNFYERTKSFIGHWLFRAIYPSMIPNKQTAVFRKHVDPNFPDLLELSKQSPLVMVNTNELYEMARPTLHKVVNIGGVGMQFKDAKPLEKEFQTIVDKSKKGVVVFTFGSVTRMELMPQNWKEAFMTAFGSFPDYEFILRYEGNDMESFRPKNVHLYKWLPQNDLLKHPKTVGFISHGGYNSVQEALNSGQPIMTIPLFGDQPKNAKGAEQLGFGINVVKTGLSAETLQTALNEMLGNKKYANVAKRISDMVRKKPIKPDELLLKWTDFLAEFREFENLVPHGTKLNWFVYHSLDVIAFLSISIFLILFILYKTIRFTVCKCCSLCRSNGKTKKE